MFHVKLFLDFITFEIFDKLFRFFFMLYVNNQLQTLAVSVLYCLSLVVFVLNVGAWVNISWLWLYDDSFCFLRCFVHSVTIQFLL